MNKETNNKHWTNSHYMKFCKHIEHERPTLMVQSPAFVFSLATKKRLDQMKEIWKKVQGYDGDYEISNLGRVKSHKKWRNTLLKPSNDSYLS